MTHRSFRAFVKIIGWWCISFGIHIDPKGPHIAIHFPGGWAMLGWAHYDPDVKMTWKDGCYGICD